MFIFGREAASSFQPHHSSFTSATLSPQSLPGVSLITSSSTAKPRSSSSSTSGTEHSQTGSKEKSGSSQSIPGTSEEGTVISARNMISICEEGYKFGGRHLSIHGQEAWQGQISSNPASSSSSSTQSGRELRGSGGSGANLVTYNCKFNGTLCATDTLACRSNLTGGKTTSVSLRENNQLIN